MSTDNDHGITGELREWIGTVAWLDDSPAHKNILAIADRIDAAYRKAEDEWKAKDGQTWLRGYGECHAELMEGNEVIAADLERAGWVRLPVDGEAPSKQLGEWIEKRGLITGPLDHDGELWHSGDMSDSNWGVIESIAFENGRWLISGHDTSAPWIPADSIRHHHQPTVEDVLCELLDKVDDDRAGQAEIIAEYAAKLQLRGDA